MKSPPTTTPRKMIECTIDCSYLTMASIDITCHITVASFSNHGWLNHNLNDSLNRHQSWCAMLPMLHNSTHTCRNIRRWILIDPFPVNTLASNLYVHANPRDHQYLTNGLPISYTSRHTDQRYSDLSWFHRMSKITSKIVSQLFCSWDDIITKTRLYCDISLVRSQLRLGLTFGDLLPQRQQSDWISPTSIVPPST